MKRTTTIFALIFAAAMLLAGCKKEPLPAVYTVYSYGAPYTIDTQGRTISDGTYTYGYEYAASGSSVSFTYPDGNVYSAGIQSANSSGAGGVSAGSVSADYDYSSGYTDPLSLCYALTSPRETERAASSGSNHSFVALLLCGVGIFNLAAPKASWYLSYGWRFKDAEPSDAAITLSRIGGAIAVVIGVIMLIA